MAKAYWVATYRSISDPEAKAAAAHDSAAYQAALEVLGKAVDRDLRIIEGVE